MQPAVGVNSTSDLYSFHSCSPPFRTDVPHQAVAQRPNNVAPGRNARYLAHNTDNQIIPQGKGGCHCRLQTAARVAADAQRHAGADIVDIAVDLGSLR